MNSCRKFKSKYSEQAQAILPILQVQRWAPYADRRMSVQILLGFGGVSLNAQYLGNRSDAEAELGKSGVLQIPGTWVRALPSLNKIQGHSVHLTGALDVCCCTRYLQELFVMLIPLAIKALQYILPDPDRVPMIYTEGPTKRFCPYLRKS